MVRVTVSGFGSPIGEIGPPAPASAAEQPQPAQDGGAAAQPRAGTKVPTVDTLVSTSALRRARPVSNAVPDRTSR